MPCPLLSKNKVKLKFFPCLSLGLNFNKDTNVPLIYCSHKTQVWNTSAGVTTMKKALKSKWIVVKWN